MVLIVALIKTSISETNFYLPVNVLTSNGYVKKIRYYENEATLFKAYRQLKFINSNKMIPLYPVVCGLEVRYND